LPNYLIPQRRQAAPRGVAAQPASAAAPGGMLIN
ncbi:hypothetical protein, partial [Klebsiella pneumoniae]